MSDIKVYNKEIEDLFLRFLVSDHEIFVRCLGILKPSLFKNPKNKDSIEFILEHVNTYSDMPLLDQIESMTKNKIEVLKDIHSSHIDWFLCEFEQFARHREMEDAIYAAPDLLEEGRYGEVEDKIKKAVSIGLVRDLGIDYFSDPKSRLEDIRNNNGMHSTGFKSLDKKLYGGFNRGELNIFAGQSGSGKSLFLQNIALNWVEQGLHVVYLSLELSEKLCSMRLDAMTTGYATTEVMRNIDDVALRVGIYHKKHAGSLRIKQLKNGCTANDIRSYIKEYEIERGIKVDGIAIDYLDLCMPTNAKVSMNDTFIKDKFVCENLRDMAVDLDVLLISASQLNRQSYDTIEFDPSCIAGGISKINTADNVFGIFTTPNMRENGRYQLQLMKTRSSSGVGQNVELEFCTKSLRISDLPENAISGNAVQGANIMQTLKRSGATNPPKGDKSESKTQMQDLHSLLKDINISRD